MILSCNFKLLQITNKIICLLVFFMLINVQVQRLIKKIRSVIIATVIVIHFIKQFHKQFIIIYILLIKVPK